MAGHVYVSYAGHDAGYVRRLVEHLANSWLTVWVDLEVTAGDRWEQSLESPIRAASVMLVVMSPASQNSDRVRGEILYAHRIGRPIIPLLLAGRAFFSQGGAAPENVIGGRMPDDTLIDKLGEVSQTPVTHRKSGKPGRGSSSRPADRVATGNTGNIPVATGNTGNIPVASVTGTGVGLGGPMSGANTTMLGSVRPPQQPFQPPPPPPYQRGGGHGNGYHGDDDYDDYDDDPPRRRLGTPVIAGGGTVLALLAGVVLVFLLNSGGDEPSRPSSPVGASNSKSAGVTTGPVPTSGPPTTVATTGPAGSTTTSKKPPTTTPPAQPTNPPPPTVPTLTTLSILADSIVEGGTPTSATVTLSGTYTGPLTVMLTVDTQGIVSFPLTVDVPAGSTSANFPVTGVLAGTATITATLNGVTRTDTIMVTAAEPPT